LQGYRLLGQLYAQQKRLDEARAEFENLLKRNPTSVPTQTMIGMIHEAQGHLPQAEKSYESVLAVNARAAVAANNLAWLYVASNRKLDDALKWAQVAFEQLNDEPHVQDTLGWILVKKDSARRAVPLLEAAAKKIPGEPQFRYHLGMAYFKNGDWTNSRVQLKKALSLKPDLDGAEEARKTLSKVGVSHS
jgi:Tfp pilus assembly protein PilF